MSNFTDSDLQYSGYKTTAYPSDDPKVTGKPDSTMLNRGETWEMVHFINRYMTGKKWTSLSTFQKLEAFLKDHKESSKSHKFWTDELDSNFKV